MNMYSSLLFVDIIFHARIFYSVNRLFYIISQLSLFFKKRGPAFPILLPPPPFPPCLPVLDRALQSVINGWFPPARTHRRCSRARHGGGPCLQHRSVPHSISRVCFRALAHPPYRSPPLPLYRSPRADFLAAAPETPAKRGRGRPKGSKNKKSGTSATEAPGEEAPKRKRGRPPKVRIASFLPHLPVAFLLLIIHHSPIHSPTTTEKG